MLEGFEKLKDYYTRLVMSSNNITYININELAKVLQFINKNGYVISNVYDNIDSITIELSLINNIEHPYFRMTVEKDSYKIINYDFEQNEIIKKVLKNVGNSIINLIF